jgi:hypothetical protein
VIFIEIEGFRVQGSGFKVLLVPVAFSAVVGEGEQLILEPAA